MKQESLDKTLTAVVSVVNELDIDTADKLELTINLYHLLKDRDEYNKKIQLLMSSNKDVRFKQR